MELLIICRLADDGAWYVAHPILGPGQEGRIHLDPLTEQNCVLELKEITE